MSLSPEQLATRLEGIAATDVAPIVGCHPQRVPLHVYEEKLGLAKPFEGNERTKWGWLLEPSIRADYEERHGVTVELHGTLRHPKYDWWFATPDGLVFRPRAVMPERGLEIKVHGRDAVWFGGLEYGAPGTDEVPAHELIQCQWGMGCSGLDRWDLVAFLDGYPVEYTIERDDELIEMLAERCERFLVDHVRARVPPPPDGSKAWEEWLSKKWKTNTERFDRIDDDRPAMALVAYLRAARGDLADAQRRTTVATQLIKQLIGNRAGLSWREPGRAKPDKITWKRSKDSMHDDWRGTAAQMRLAASLVTEATAPVIAELEHRLETGQVLFDTQGADLELVLTLRDALHDIARMPVHKTAVAGGRPFNVPRHWKTSRPADHQLEEPGDQPT